MRTLESLALSIAACMALAGRASAQTTWYVDLNAAPPGSGTIAAPYASIQYAHDQPSTVDFDTLLVAPGTYFENITLTKRITVRATAGAERTTLSPAAAGPILSLFGPLDEPQSITVEDFTITGVFGPPHIGAVLSADGQLVRCIVRGNRGGPYRGVDNAYDIWLVDCTVVDNDVGVECSFINEFMWLRNCIVWGNTTNDLQQGISGLSIRYCAGGPFPSVSDPTNVIGDPGLWDLAGGDYHLAPGSPCIDAGDPMLPSDPDGSRGDIGYYAWDPSYPYAFCFGDGTFVDHTTPCPCGNVGAMGHGCAHSFSALGALLDATGSAASDDIVLTATNTPATSFTLFLQHDAAGDAVFHDGVLCAGGTLIRLRGRAAVAGQASFPNPAWDSSITLSQRGGVFPGQGVRRYYAAWYRNASTSFCPPATANVTNGWGVDW